MYLDNGIINNNLKYVFKNNFYTIINITDTY